MIGLGKVFKFIIYLLCVDILIMLGVEGFKNVVLVVEICDGWLFIFYLLCMVGMYNEWFDEGFVWFGVWCSCEDFEICVMV